MPRGRAGPRPTGAAPTPGQAADTASASRRRGAGRDRPPRSSLPSASKPRSRRRRTVLGATTSCYNAASAQVQPPSVRRNFARQGLILPATAIGALPPILRYGRQRRNCLRFVHMSVGLGSHRWTARFSGTHGRNHRCSLPHRGVELGAGRVVSEMVASEEIVARGPRPRHAPRSGSASSGRPCSSRAARRTGWPRPRAWSGQGARIIDINFGCPAKKVTGGLRVRRSCATPTMRFA